MTDKERIEVYVNRMPKNCMECLFGNEAVSSDDYCVCGAVKNGMCQSYEQAKNKEDCPLKTIQSIQNQRVVEALEKVKEFVIDYIEFKDEHQESWLYEFIDQLIKEYGGKDE